MHLALPILLIAFQLLIAPGLAMWRGGLPERLMAAAYLVASLATSGISLLRHGRFAAPEFAILAVDTAMFGVACWTATRANRWWPMWFSALQGMAVLAHLWRMTIPAMPVAVYYAVTQYAAYPLWLMILAGTLTHDRRLVRYGVDPPWKRSSPAMAGSEPLSGRVRP